MITGNYNCLLCHKEYEPTKRGRQLYCSTKCCKKANYHKNKFKKSKPLSPSSYKSFTKKEENIPSLKAEVILPKPTKKTEIEKVSGAGITNAALGALAADATKAIANHFLVPPENKPATQKDIQEVKDLINKRYYQIHGLAPTYDGTIPHFDMVTRTIVYLKDLNYRNPAFNMI